MVMAIPPRLYFSQMRSSNNEAARVHLLRRRDFVMLLGGAAAAWPLAARAQPAERIYRIGFLTPRSHASPTGRDAFSAAFIDGMSKLGYNEGKNLTVEWRYAAGDYARLTGFASELVGINLPVIVTYGTAAGSCRGRLPPSLSSWQPQSIWWVPELSLAWHGQGGTSRDYRSSTRISARSSWNCCERFRPNCCTWPYC